MGQSHDCEVLVLKAAALICMANAFYKQRGDSFDFAYKKDSVSMHQADK
jgi:hypothetical protein